MLIYVCNICEAHVTAEDAYITKVASGKYTNEWGLCPQCWARMYATACLDKNERVPTEKFERKIDIPTVDTQTVEPEIEEPPKTITVEEQRAEAAQRMVTAKPTARAKVLHPGATSYIGGKPTVVAPGEPSVGVPVNKSAVDFQVKNGRNLTQQAVKYIHEQNAAGTSIAQIARNLGVPYATVYNHT